MGKAVKKTESKIVYVKRVATYPAHEEMCVIISDTGKRKCQCKGKCQMQYGNRFLSEYFGSRNRLYFAISNDAQQHCWNGVGFIQTKKLLKKLVEQFKLKEVSIVPYVLKYTKFMKMTRVEMESEIKRLNRHAKNGLQVRFTEVSKETYEESFTTELFREDK